MSKNWVEKKVPNIFTDWNTNVVINVDYDAIRQRRIRRRWKRHFCIRHRWIRHLLIRQRRKRHHQIVEFDNVIWKLQKSPHVACTAQAADVFQSTKVGNYINEFWWLIKKCHYLLHYIVNQCIHMVFENYISTVINDYFIHFDFYYCKNSKLGYRKEVYFWLRSNLWLFTVL